MHNNVFSLGTIHAVSGAKVTGTLPILGGGTPLPMTVIHGRQAGSTLLLTTGIHCAETVGIQAAMELAAELQPEMLSGTLMILPLVNRNGFEHRSMSLVQEDGKNLNRVFPGDRHGTLSQRIAYTLTTEVFPLVDFYIDLHGGDGFEALTPYIYAAGIGTPAVVARSQEMAMQADVPYLVVSSVASGGAYNTAAASYGIPSVLLERGGMGTWSRTEVEQDKKDVRNLLRYLGMLHDAPEPVSHTPVKTEQVTYQTVQHTGCWYPVKQVGEFINAGECIGTIRDYTGTVLADCIAKHDGVLLYQVQSLTIISGNIAVAYAKLPNEKKER